MNFKLGPLSITIPAFNIPVFLAVFTTLGFFSLLGKICLYEVPQGSKEIAFTMLGSIATAWVGVVTYYFGSSAGSAKKTEIMAQQSNGKDN